jgi:hypothetical protein
VCARGVAVRWKCNATRFPVSLLRQELFPFTFRALPSSYDFLCFQIIWIGFELTVQVISNDVEWFQVTPNEINWVQLFLFSSGYKYVQSISCDFKWFHLIPIDFTQFQQVSFVCLRLNSNDLKWTQMCSNHSKWFHISLNDFNWKQLSSNTTHNTASNQVRRMSIDVAYIKLRSVYVYMFACFRKCVQVILKNVKCLQGIASDFKHNSVISAECEWFQMRSNDFGWSLLTPSDLEWFQMSSVNFK